MKVIVKEVVNEDWRAIYLNDEIVAFGYHITIADLCEQLQHLINLHEEEGVITSIVGERYRIVGSILYDFPAKFSDIPQGIITKY